MGGLRRISLPAPDLQDQATLARWAADCAERVLAHFEAHHEADDRPRQAIEAARAWARGELTVSEARDAARAAHAAARASTHPAARAAGRAAAHAAATAHLAAHARHASAYALLCRSVQGLPRARSM
jgi:hypothetical protein